MRLRYRPVPIQEVWSEDDNDVALSITPGVVIDPNVRTAIAQSTLRDLPQRVIEDLVADARKATIHAGGTLHHEGETEPHIELVVSGLVRVHVSSPDGRTMTVRYCRRGALIGVPTLYVYGMGRPFAIQALADSDVLRLRPDTFRRLADRDVRVARALLTETSTRVFSFVAELSGTAFATVRQRLARHLLDLVAENQRGRDLVASVTQQQLADATGTVREVVVRVLRELREEGVVATGRRGVVILDPERLFGSADADWNEGS